MAILGGLNNSVEIIQNMVPSGSNKKDGKSEIVIVAYLQNLRLAERLQKLEYGCPTMADCPESNS